jgi:hypothetical protein
LLIIGTGLVIAGLIPVAAYAEAPRMDTPTQNALAALRTGAVGMVASLSKNKGVSGDDISASYNGTLAAPTSRANTVMVVKARAEQAAWTTMDPTSRALIKSYFGAVAAAR